MTVGWGIMRKDVLDGFPFRWQASLSETTTYNTPIFWDWAIRYQWMWAPLSLSIFWGRKERTKRFWSSQDSLALWS